MIRTTVGAGALYFIIAFAATFILYWPSDYMIVTTTPQQIVEAAINSINNIKAAYAVNKEDDKWFRDSASQAAIRNLDKSLHDAKADLMSSNYNPAAIPAILTACDNMGDLGGGRRLFKPGCELDDYLQGVPFKGDVIPNIYNLQGQIGLLKPKFEALRNYVTLVAAVQTQWRNALLASLIWAVMAAVFAVTVLLYRRQELWDGLTLKKIPDFVPAKEQEREAWRRKPLYDMGKLSPLEALRYPVFRARLADHMNAQAARPKVPKLQIVA